MLDARAAALEQRDVEAFLAPMTPEAREAERHLAQSILSVPSRGFSLTLRPSATPIDGQFTGTSVDLAYLYDGLPDDNVFNLALTYDVVKQDGSWIISAAQIQADAPKPPWLTGPIEHTRFDVFLAMFRPGLPNPTRTLEIAKRARDQLAPKVTYPLETSYLIVLAKDRAEYDQLAASDSPVSSIAQAETTYQITPDSIAVRSRHIVVNLQALNSTGSALETLQHELGHLALSRDTRPFTPTWVSESAALFLSDSRPRETWQFGVRNGRFDSLSFAQLSRTGTLGGHDVTGRTASLEYAYAAAAAYHLVENFGAVAYWSFYRSYADVPAERVYAQIPEGATNAQSRDALQGLSSEVTVEALQRIFGLTEFELDIQVREWIERQVR